MTKGIFAVALVGAVAAGANAQWNIAGEFQGWDNAAAAWTMADQGGGIFELTTTDLLANDHAEFKVVATGDWGNAFPGSGNAWVYVPTDNAEITFTHDTNTYADGWFPESNRYWTSTQTQITTWHAVGPWQGWDPSNPASLMTNVGGDIYELDWIIPTAGTYEYKVTTGSWDRQAGSDGVGVNSATLFFDTTTDNEAVKFQFNAGNGTLRVIPTPGTLALMGLGGIAAMRRRR